MKKLLLLFTFISLACVGVGQNHFIESFENPDSWSGYTTGTVNFNSGDWDFVEVYPETSGDSYDGSKACRINDDEAGASITSPSVNGVGTLSFYYHRPFSGTGSFELQKSVDGGDYTTLATVDFSDVTTPTEYSYDVNDASNNIKIRILNDDNSAHLTIDYFTMGEAGGNASPNITNISISPIAPTSSDAVSISADVTDSDGTIAGVELHWGTTSGSLNTTIDMTNSGGNTYTTDSDIPAQSGGTTVYYEVYALDDEAGETTSLEQSYTVLKDEPTNHVTGFAATANSSSQITTTWTDAVGSTLPDGYLVKAATGGNPTAPVDGIAESDGTLVKNIAHGSKGEAVFTGLDAETEYNFMIWSYTNSGDNINYKTDTDPDPIPSASATTQEAPATPDLIISEVADPGDDYEGRFVELYNVGNTVIDFSSTTVYFSRQANGGNHSSTQLTGTIAPYETYVIGNSSNISTLYGFDADLDFGSVTGNGDDGYFLYFDGDETTGTLMDAYGVEDVDGTGEDWEYEDSRAVRNSNITSPNATWTASEWTITDPANVADMTPGEHNDYVSAKSDGDWNTASIWSNGSVPTSTENVVVPANTELTIVSTKATGTCNDITLEDGATLVGQENLTVNGTIYVKKAFTAYSSTSASDGWYAVSSPVSSMTIAGSDFDPGTNDDLYEYDENSNMWLNYTDGTFGDNDFLAGKGYLVSYETTATKSFEGTAFSADGITPTLGETNTKWNLVGNPYPSKLTYANINAANISSPKTLNETTGSWDDLGTEVEVGEGIFVFAEGSSSLTFNLDDQTHGSGNKATPSYAFLRANFDDGLSVFARFGTDASASKNYEWKYDSRYLYPATSIPYLSTITEDEVMASTYVFNDETESVVVPLYFSVSKEREISFSTDGNIGYKMAIEDNIDGSITEIDADNPFEFSALPSDNEHRFNLHLTKSSTIGVEENSELTAANVYAHEQNIYFNADKDLTNATLTVYNTIGQQVLHKNVESGSEIIRMESRGAYVVKVQADEGSLTEKVIIQ